MASTATPCSPSARVTKHQAASSSTLRRYIALADAGYVASASSNCRVRLHRPALTRLLVTLTVTLTPHEEFLPREPVSDRSVCVCVSVSRNDPPGDFRSKGDSEGWCPVTPRGRGPQQGIRAPSGRCWSFGSRGRRTEAGRDSETQRERWPWCTSSLHFQREQQRKCSLRRLRKETDTQAGGETERGGEGAARARTRMRWK